MDLLWENLNNTNPIVMAEETCQQSTNGRKLEERHPSV